MSGIGAPPLTVVQPGEGRAGDLGSIGVAFKLWGEDTGGAISIVEHPFPVGALVPRTCTRGRMSTPSSPRARSASGPATGGRARARRVHHQAARRAAHDVERRQRAGPDDRGHQPGRIRALLPGVDRPHRGRSTRLAAIGALAEAYGLQFGEAPWLPDVIARYRLIPPFGTDE